MSEFKVNEGFYRSSGADSEVERDGLTQSMLGYYTSRPARSPEPDPTGHEAGIDLPGSLSVKTVMLFALGVVAAVVRRLIGL